MSEALAALRQLAAAPPPWWQPYLEPCRRVAAVSAEGRDAAQALEAAQPPDAWPRFVGHAQLPAGEAYEAFIARTAGIPTRDNLHDLFNGLVCLRFPQLKRRLNLLQAAQIARHGVGRERGPVRDALTLFDENGAWLQAPAVLSDALQRRDWQALFVTHRAAWRDARLVLFGHALLEKLQQPRKAITAHACLVPEGADAAPWLAEWLTPERLATKPFMPLPVLGVPGWWSANERPAFYDDAGVFRRQRG